MANKPIDFSQPIEELLGGGSFFEPGLYRVLTSHFTYFDYGKEGNDALVLKQELQPVDAKHKDSGEVVTRYFGVGGSDRDGNVYIEPCDPVKGVKKAWKSIRFTDKDTRGKIGKTTDFGVFLEHAAKNGVDLDAISNDWTNAEGVVYEYGTYEAKKTTRTKTAVEEAEDGDEGGKNKGGNRDTKTYIVLVGQPKAAKKAAKKDEDEGEEDAPKSKKSAKDDDDDNEDDKPKKKGGKVSSEDFVAEYLDKVVKKEVKKYDSADRSSHKLQFAKWLTNEKEVDADTKKAVMKVYNDDDSLDAVAKTVGLARNKADEFVMDDDD